VTLWHADAAVTPETSPSHHTVSEQQLHTPPAFTRQHFTDFTDSVRAFELRSRDRHGTWIASIARSVLTAVMPVPTPESLKNDTDLGRYNADVDHPIFIIFSRNVPD